MSKLKDLIGQRFGRLTVVERAENKIYGNKQKATWLCHCDCGNDVIVVGESLRTGATKSCGCLHKEGLHTIHGMRYTKLYTDWLGIKARCSNPKSIVYKHYGGRSITFYPAWADDFQAFYDYVSKLEHFGEKGYSLDRIDNNGNYEPGNVRWADRNTQARNKRNNVMVEYKGEIMCLKDASNLSGVNQDTLRCRIQRGETGDYLFRLPHSHRLFRSFRQEVANHEDKPILPKQ